MPQTSQTNQNAQLWHLIRKLEIARGNKKLIVTTEQQYQLCNYMNGKPYSREILKDFIK